MCAHRLQHAVRYDRPDEKGFLMPLRVLVITNMYPTPSDPAFGTFVADEVAALRHRGLSIDVLFIDGKRSVINYALAIPRLWWRLLRHRYDVIHAHYVLSGLIARLQRHMPVVVTFHGAEVALGWPARASRWLRDRVDAVIVTSRRVQNDLDAPSAYVIPPGVDLAQFVPDDRATARKELGLPDDGELVLFVGRADWDKRLDVVHEAVRLLHERRPQAELVQVSGQPHAVVPTYMNACDALLLISTYEGSPMVVKEALACNLPVVASDVGDVAELIEHLQGCALCDGSAPDAAAKLAQVLGRGRLGDGKDAVAALSVEETAARVAAVYERVVERSKRPE